MRARVEPLQRGRIQGTARHFVPPTLQPADGARIELRPGEGDAPVAAIDQMARQRRSRIGLRKTHRVNARLTGGFHHMHAGDAAGFDQRTGGRALAQAGDDQAGRAVRQLLAQELLLFAVAVMRDADQGLVAGRPQHVLHRFDQIHEQGVRQQWNQHRHMRAGARGQGACRRVGHIAELAHCGHHPLHQFRRDCALAAQRARHGDGADAGGLGHVGKGDAPRCAAAR